MPLKNNRFKGEQEQQSENEKLQQLYLQLKKDIDIKIEKFRNDWYNKHCCEAEIANRKNEMRTLFQKVTQERRQTEWKMCGNIRYKDGNMLTKDTDILKRWHEYGMGLYNANIATAVDVLDQLWPNCKKDEQEPCILKS